MPELRKMKEKDLITLADEWYENARNNRAPREEKWMRYHKMYSGFLPGRDSEISSQYPTRSKIFTPEGFAIINTKLAAFRSAFEGTENLVEWDPVGPTDFEEANAVTDYENYRLNQVARLKFHLPETILDTLIYGTGFMKALWNEQKKGMDLFPIDAFDIYPDPYARTEVDAAYVIHRQFISETTFDKFLERKIFTQGLPKDAAVISDDMNWQEQKLKEVGWSTPPKDQSSGKNKKARLLEVWEFWTQDEMFAVVGGKHIVRPAGPHPYSRIPIFRVPNYIRPHEFYGDGEYALMEYLLLEKVLLRNVLMDSAMLKAQPTWIVDRNAAIDPEDYIISPAHRIEFDGSMTNRANPITPLDMGPIPAEAYAMEQAISGDLQEATAVSDFQRGQPQPAPHPTAQGLRIFQAGTNQRLSLQLASFKNFLVEPLAMFSLALDRKLMTPQDVFSVVESGIKVQKIMTKDMLGNVSINLKASGSPMMGNQVLHGNNMLNVGTIAKQWGVKFNERKLVREIAKNFEMPNVQEIFPEGPAVGNDPEQENLAMAQGIAVPVTDADDHEGHMETHEEMIPSQEEGGVQALPVVVQMVLGEHVGAHQIKMTQSGGGVNAQVPANANPLTL